MPAAAEVAAALARIGATADEMAAAAARMQAAGYDTFVPLARR